MSGSWGPSTRTRWTPGTTLPTWSGEGGDAAGARDQYAALVPVYERVSGRQHPDTLPARERLAKWTAKAGDQAAARQQYAALVSIYAGVFGHEHPDTLMCRGNLA